MKMRMCGTLSLGLISLLVSCSSPVGTVSDLQATGARAVISVAGGTFTVATYNVDGLPAFLQGNGGDPAAATSTIGQKVSLYDIVQVQEDFNYHASLYASDTHPYRTATSGGAGFGSGLNTMSVFPFSDNIDRVTWNTRNSTDGNNLTPKGFTWLRMRLAEGVYVDVYNLHTCAGSDESSLAARRDNILQLVSYIQTNSAGNAVIVCGDTNTRYTRTGDNIRTLQQAMTGDVWVNLVRGGTPPVQGSDALVWESAEPVPSLEYEFVDKIFYRSNGYITLTPEIYQIPDAEFRTADGQMLSDHRPIVTRFRYDLNAGLQLSDQFGGPHGTSFSDVNSVPANPVVTSVSLRAGSRIDQMGLALSTGVTFQHGGSGGTAQALTLSAGETIKSLTLSSGEKDGRTRIFSARFTTSQGRVLSGGTVTNSVTTYTAPAGWQIVGFHGRSGNEVDKVGVVYAPLP